MSVMKCADLTVTIDVNQALRVVSIAQEVLYVTALMDSLDVTGTLASVRFAITTYNNSGRKPV